MPDTNHLNILERGRDTWNAWRQEEPTIQPNLKSANLRGEELWKFNLQNTALDEADLSRANLYQTDFENASMVRADLTHANLTLANMTDANLRNAKLTSVLLWKTNLEGTTLLDATGLDSCRHEGGCKIDQWTLARSNDLSDDFLRLLGLEEKVVAHYRWLFNNNIIQFHSCFISHSSKDEIFAKKLYYDLIDLSVNCWFAPEDLSIGSRFRNDIHTAIDDYDKLLLILSEHSINSHFVEDEVERALEKERAKSQDTIFPIRLDDAAMQAKKDWPFSLRSSRHIGDFSNWQDDTAYTKALSRLIRDLSLTGTTRHRSQILRSA